ncbi:MAG TPA: glycosyltransferase family 1 protein [Vicinamibacteria bacterium]|nr:glycosyltransferase family 1 protein [Vicinamibacteria bacterium]
MDARPLVVGIDARELAGRPTGTGRYLRNLVRHWRESGDRLLCYFNGPPALDPVLDHPSVVSRAVGHGVSPGVYWQERQLPPAAREDGLDVFFSPAYSCPLSLDLPRVTTVHDLSFFAHPQDFALLDGLRRRVLVRLSLRASRAVTVVSDFTRRELLRLFPDLDARVVHVPHGSDDDMPPLPPRAEARERLRIAGPFVITVGTVLNRRCLPELLRAASRLLPRHPGLVLDVVGENRTHPRLDLRSLVGSLDLDAHVRLSGFVEDAALADRYAAADAAVFLSEYEGFGLPALESLARGVPTVVSRAPALGEIFRDAAFLVEPRAETAVAAALDRVLTDEALRARLVEAGRALAARHSWAEAARRTRDALREAAGR